MQIHAAIKKLRNARFQPPQGGPEEKLHWITDGEADLLRSIGGSGKRGKFGFKSYGLGDKGNAVGSGGASNYSGDGRGGQVNMNGVGRGQANVLRQINGRWSSVSRADAARLDAGGAMQPARSAAPVTQRVAQPIVAPPVPAVKPPVALAPVPVPRMKPAVRPAIAPQNYGFVAPAMTPRAPAPAPSIAPQNFGFAAPMRAPAPAPRAAPMTRAAEIRADRAPSGGFRPSSYREAAVRTDRAPTAPGAGVRAVPEGPRTDRMPSGSFRPSSYREPSVRDDRMTVKTRADVPGLSGTFDGGRRFGAQRTIGSPARAPAPLAKQDIRGDLTDIHPLANPDKFSYPRGMASTLTGVNPDALNMALATQKRYGAPLITTSGLRSPFQNKKAKGVEKSQHMLGNALDFAIPDTQGDDTARLLDAMRRSGFTGRGGYRPGKVHGDVRAKETLWGPDTHGSSIGRLPRGMQDALRGRGAYAGLDGY